MAAGAIAYREARRLLADLLVLPLVLVHLRYRILLALLLQPHRQLRHGEPRRAADDELLQRVVDEFVLFLGDTEIRGSEILSFDNNLSNNIE